jgi:flagellar biosynthetic protein FliR
VPWELINTYLRVPLLAMVVCRLAGMIMFLPILGALSIPATIRALLVIGLAFLVTPFVDYRGDMPATVGGLALALGGELLLGSLVGMVVAACFYGMQLGGLMIAQETGAAFGSIVDPTTGVEETIISGFYLQLGAVVFLIFGGHRALVSACIESFGALPVLSGWHEPELALEALLKALAVGTETGIRVAAPVALTMFVVNLAMGFVSRTVPQLNVATLGFAVKSLAAFAIMMVSLPAAAMAFVWACEQAAEVVQALIGL